MEGHQSAIVIDSMKLSRIERVSAGKLDLPLQLMIALNSPAK